MTSIGEGCKEPDKPTQDQQKSACHHQERSGQLLNNEKTTFPIIAIGASAGGLEAIIQLLKLLPENIQLAIVLIQHLDSRHLKELHEILLSVTGLQIVETTQDMPVMISRIYISPPNTNVSIVQKHFYLSPHSATEGRYQPINHFFSSLAKDRKKDAIGIVLSGMASDGVQGLKEIKEAGGITFAQDVKSAKFHELPHSAIISGCVDFVLSPEEIANALIQIAQDPASHLLTTSTSGREVDDESLNMKENMAKIINLLHNYTGVDFHYYKQSTVVRRVQRRMLLHKFISLQSYVEYLQNNSQEVNALFHDILINVTSFFRDIEVFSALKEKVFPNIIKNRSSESPIRIWIPGCSTGEEAYSIAICLTEFLREQSVSFPVQIFATDINEQAIDIARTGIYAESLTESVSPNRLRYFFHKQESGHQVNKSVREICIFSRHNVFKDPPFSKLDLISCRNLLIYLSSTLQKKVLPIFHYALKPTGFLLLGTSETIGCFADLFSQVDTKYKIYAKKGLIHTTQLEFGSTYAIAENQRIEHRRLKTMWSNEDVNADADRIILNTYGPPGVIIDEQFEILQFRGSTGAYLEPAPGFASLNLLKMVKNGLAPELYALVQRAIQEDVSTRKEGLCLITQDGTRDINIAVIPIKGRELKERCFLVMFEEASAPTKETGTEKEGQPKTRNDKKDELIRLQQELSATKEYLHSIIEQQRVANEELVSSFEEIQTSNEELQSTNEELETAKEELQVTNEQLAHANEELEMRNETLSQINSDLNNLVGSIFIPLLIVAPDLKIRRFSPLAGQLLNLAQKEVGKTLADIKHSLISSNLYQCIHDVIDSGTTKELEGQDQNRCWYQIRIHPYFNYDKRSIDGAVITFTNIHDIKLSLETLQADCKFVRAILDSVKCPLLVLDENLRVLLSNEVYLREFKVTKKETEGNLLYYLGNGQWGIPDLRALLENTRRNNESFDSFVVEHEFNVIGRKRMAVSGRQICMGADQQSLVLMHIEELRD